MEFLERALHEHARTLVDELMGTVGLSPREAEGLLREAGPALVESYRWQARQLAPDSIESVPSVRDLLAGMPGNALAPRVGLSTARTWAGLRALVPAVVRATAPDA